MIFDQTRLSHQGQLRRVLGQDVSAEAKVPGRALQNGGAGVHRHA